ncbi:hypothetical protein C8J57DRAFT_1226099 [Mycena rebaudengoi]|nr:hypothetical protein C8J57DRAFT_1226099 [Mycena rebaudengoi]
MTTSDFTLSSGGESTLKQEKRTRRAIKHAAGLRALVFVMHGFLVAMHIGLLIISLYGFERRVRVPVGKPTTVLSLVISISSQTFAINFAVWDANYDQYSRQTGCMERTWVCRKCLVEPTVDSSLHLGCWNYLTLTAGLKVTTTALFRLVLANQTVSFTARSTPNSPFLHSSLVLMNKRGRTTDGFGLGLQNNMLYDIVAADTGPGTTIVNTHTMNVTCGTLSTSSTTQLEDSNGRLYWVPTRPRLNAVFITETAPNVLRIASVELSEQMGGGHPYVYNSSTIEVFGSFNVSDTSGKAASHVFLHPPMNPPLSAGAEITPLHKPNITAISVSTLSYTRCSLDITNSSLPLDTSSRSLLSPGGPRKTTSSWPIFIGNETLNSAGGTESLVGHKL